LKSLLRQQASFKEHFSYYKINESEFKEYLVKGFFIGTYNLVNPSMGFSPADYEHRKKNDVFIDFKVVE
jgi:hypothetical protein